MSALAREEFEGLVARFGYQRTAPVVTDTLAAFDAIATERDSAIAELAKLEARCKQLSDIRDEWRANAEANFDETVGLRTRIAELESPAHRARIAREFLEEPCPVPHHHGLGLDCQEKRLARWEAAGGAVT